MAELGCCQGQLALLWSPCACYLIPQLSINFSSWVVFRSSWMLIVTFLVASRLIAVLAGSYWGTSTPLTLSGCGASGTARIGSISFGRSVGAPLVLAPILLSCIYWTWFFLPLFFSLLCSVLIPLSKSLRNTIYIIYATHPPRGASPSLNLLSNPVILRITWSSLWLDELNKPIPLYKFSYCSWLW